MRAFQVVGLPLLKPIGKDGSALSVVVSSDRLELHPRLPLLHGRERGSERIAAQVRILHHNPITPYDRDEAPIRTMLCSLWRWQFPLMLTTVTFTPERHCDDVAL